MLNRSAVVLTVKPPFLDWVLSLPDPMPSDTSLSDLQSDRSVYLLPEWDTHEDRDALLGDAYEVLFENQLEGWWRVEDDWPKKRTLKMFREWFDVEYHSVIEDLVGDRLLDDEL